MKSIPVKDLLDGLLDIEDDLYYIYVVRDSQEVLYVGKSVNPEQRLYEDFGVSWRSAGSSLYPFYEQNREIASEWEVELYTLGDCEQYVVQHFPTLSLERYRDFAYTELSIR